MTKYTELSVQDHRLELTIGCLDEERENPQTIRIDYWIRFPEPPPGCQTDELKDTVCYAEVLDRIQDSVKQATSEEERFYLIEKLARTAYLAVMSTLPNLAKAKVEVTKVNPPVKSIKGGVHFSYGDF